MASNAVVVLPHLAILRVESMPSGPVDEFQKAVAADGLEFHSESHAGGPYAGVEWLLPTACVLLITRKYFDSFLSEMGKDHYHVLKRAIKALGKRVLGSDAPVVDVIGTAGKVDTQRLFSFAFSIIAEVEDGLSIKLLIQSRLNDEDRDKALSEFLVFLAHYHASTLDTELVKALGSARIISRVLLVTYNDATGSIEPVDPIPRKP